MFTFKTYTDWWHTTPTVGKEQSRQTTPMVRNQATTVRIQHSTGDWNGEHYRHAELIVCDHIDTSNESGIHCLKWHNQLAELPTVSIPTMSTFEHQLGIEKTVEVSNYMKALFKVLRNNDNVQVKIPSHWTLDFTQDCNYMVHLLVKAVRNPCTYISDSSLACCWQLTVTDSDHNMVGGGLRGGPSKERHSVYWTTGSHRKCIEDGVSAASTIHRWIQALHCSRQWRENPDVVSP